MFKFDVLKQHAFSKLGALKHTFGGATTWITLAIFAFSGVSAWNTPTVMIIREYVPWLSLHLFMIACVAGIVFLMWLEHFVVQSSMVLYWARMFWSKKNPLRKYMEGLGLRLDRVSKEQKVMNKKLDGLIKSNDALAEAIEKLDEATDKLNKTAVTHEQEKV